MKGINSDTENEKLQLTIHKIKKGYSLSFKCRDVVISADNAGQLFAEICQIIIEGGDYKFACIEMFDKESDKDVISVLKVQRASFKFKSSVALPIRHEGKIIGTLNVYSDKTDDFDAHETEHLEMIARDIAYGLYVLNLKKEKEEAQRTQLDIFLKTIDAFVVTMKKRDPYTAGHQQRVTELAVAIGEKMGLSRDCIDGLRLGAMIHDIGKINVPGEILNRPGKITRNEFEIIKPHSQLGYEIIRGLDFPWPIGEMILQHHERLDGMGYPKGLKGDEIITEAKIIAVADVVEAISSHRPYRVALGINAAISEIKSRRGTSFDPEIVDICVDLFKKKEFHWENDHSFLEDITA